MAEGNNRHSEITAYAMNPRKGRRPKEALQVKQWEGWAAKAGETGSRREKNRQN